MKIIDVLKQRSETVKDDIKIELKLYNLADDLEKKCRTHLKRIIIIMPEFDLHDEKHSEKVLENIEKLLGDKILNSLSSYELFLLYLSAFLHDCAMAPSDWEINTMKLTEGTSEYYQDDFSIKNDLKAPLKFSIATKSIIDNKINIYKKFESDVKEWMFSPQNEERLTDYLSTLLIEYQNFRNGFTDNLKTIKNKQEFIELNEFIRTEYIRSTHHLRIGTYIKNLETIFGNSFEQDAWGKILAHDLSLICRFHGEDSDYIEKFSINAQYFGSESANLQFVAILLRLGDIIHFSYDRAPIVLRNSKLFKSEYSFQQWAIKNNGVNYFIDNGEISFRAYCQNPETYFKLHQYIDWIDIEIQTYFRFQRKWPVTYIANLQDRINRSNIKCDEETFLPKRGLVFSLNQNRIIELLMGVGLYKEKYACLRELYQNSLDAVRCMLSLNEIDNRSTSGIIEFRIYKEENRT
jgi:Fe-S-cluster formation regulator IscX/YfhJ